jgi:hypothetical protein
VHLATSKRHHKIFLSDFAGEALWPNVSCEFSSVCKNHPFLNCLYSTENPSGVSSFFFCENSGLHPETESIHSVKIALLPPFHPRGSAAGEGSGSGSFPRGAAGIEHEKNRADIAFLRKLGYNLLRF